MAQRRPGIEALVVGILFRREDVHWRAVPINLSNSSNRSLAIAEISALVAAVYLQYRTSLMDTTYSPGINSRFELFFDQRFTSVKVTPAPVILIVARMLD